jgi:hypothetical protein
MNISLKNMLTVILMMVFAAGCNKPDGPNHGNDQGNELNGHEYVDLGLPSGTLWATCNIGTETVEEFGDYFAWGETEPKELYDWKSYQYGRFIHERYELNKYCTDSAYGLNGLVDNLTVMEPDDDVARTCWGEGWRMPTIGEWEELFLNTTGVWTTLNDVKGWCCTASNGNSLFLPAAGYWWDDAFNADLGLYWSRTINKEFPYRAWGFHFNCDSSHLCGSSDRNRGQTVRAVCSK